MLVRYKYIYFSTAYACPTREQQTLGNKTAYILYFWGQEERRDIKAIHLLPDMAFMKGSLRKIFRFLYYFVYGSSGKKIVINGEEYTVSAHIARGVSSRIDEAPLKVLSGLAGQVNVLFDIGGNIGVIAAMLAKKMKAGSVIYSFEPVPLSFEYLQDTARVQTGNARIVPVNNAVSNATEKIYFTNDGVSCLNQISAENTTETIAITPIRIDDFCRANNIVPELIKIDIEGAEYLALDGMRQTLKNNDCIVVVEIHTQQLTSSNIDNGMFASLINDIGYKAYSVNGNEIDSNRIMDHECVILSRKALQGNLSGANY
ncbi:MAG: methyltransferase FkbM family [Flavipsychrobacter sp.]|jgi:FkbM family methyltransferase|nr:methyltransferase FkbM family [Flavipsychrobacter sp.]